MFPQIRQNQSKIFDLPRISEENNSIDISHSKALILKGQDLLKISIQSSSIMDISEMQKLRKLLRNYDQKHLKELLKSKEKSYLNTENQEVGKLAQLYGYHGKAKSRVDRKNHSLSYNIQKPIIKLEEPTISLSDNQNSELYKNLIKTSPRHQTDTHIFSRYKNNQSMMSRNSNSQFSQDLTNDELKYLRKSLDPYSRPQSIMFFDNNQEVNPSTYNNNQTTQARQSLNFNNSIGSIDIQLQNPESSRNLNNKNLLKIQTQERSKERMSRDQITEQNQRVSDLLKFKRKNLEKIFKSIDKTNIKNEQLKQLYSKDNVYSLNPSSAINQSKEIHQNEREFIDLINKDLQNQDILDQSSINNLTMNKSRLLQADLKKYHFQIDAFKDKIVMEKKELNSNQSISKLDISYQVFDKSPRDEFIEQISQRGSYEFGQRIKLDLSKSYLGIISNTQNLDGLNNVDSYMNSNLNKQKQQDFMSQLQFGLKPQFSGDIDAQFNKLNLHKFSEILTHIKFLEDLDAQTKVAKIKQIRETYNSPVKLKVKFESTEKKNEQKKSQKISKISTQSTSNIQQCYHRNLINYNSEIPNARTGSKLINLDSNKILVFGGIGTDLYNDMRIYTNHDNKWKLVQYQNSDKHYVPQSRFGHTLDQYKNMIVLYGGAGHYINSLKCRYTFSDLRMFDLETNKWIEMDFSRESEIVGSVQPRKRMNHASTIFGSMLLTHGGLYQEEGQMLGEFQIFDFEQKRWIQAGVNCYQDIGKGQIMRVQSRHRKDLNLKLQLHTMVSIYNPHITTDKRQTQRLWDFPADMLNPLIPNNHGYGYGGMLMFGGIDDKKRISDKLWFIQPNQLANKSDAFAPNGSYLNLDMDTEVYITVRQIHPSGRGPLARYGHAACIFKNQQYMCIHGGRNDSLMNEQGINPMLNDINLLDFFVVYGSLLKGRTLHMMGTLNDEKFVIFGGNDLKKFCQQNLGYQINTMTKALDKLMIKFEMTQQQV
eukprot:403342363